MNTLAHYDGLADLFEYPETDYPAIVQRLRSQLVSRYARAAAALDAFTAALPPFDDGRFAPPALDEVQEIFTRSFDVQSITTLGVGYVMFGDDYKRGELLVNLSREQRDAGVDCGSELPDHLPNVLRLLAGWEDRETAAEFVTEILHPALDRMIREFEPGRMEQRNRLYRRHFKTLIASSAERGSMFKEPLAALVAVLEEDFDLASCARPEQQSDFLRAIGRELEIEANEGKPAPTGRML